MSQVPDSAFILIGLFLVVYNITIITTAFSSGVLSKELQVFHMVLYLIMSVGIGIWFTVNAMSQVYTIWSYIILGYSSLLLLSNMFYLFYLLPIPSRHRNWSTTMRLITEHANFLEGRYVSTDLSWFKSPLIIVGFGLFVLTDIYTQISTPILIACILALSTAVLGKSLKKSVFTPKTVL